MNEPPALPPESTAPMTALSPVAAAGRTWEYEAWMTPEELVGAAEAGELETVPSAAVSTVAVMVLALVSLSVSSSVYAWHSSRSGVER